MVDAHVVRALAHHAKGDRDAALAALGEALDRGVPAGYRRLYLDEGAAMVELLRRPRTRGESAAAVLAAATRDEPRAAGPRRPGRARASARWRCSGCSPRS